MLLLLCIYWITVITGDAILVIVIWSRSQSSTIPKVNKSKWMDGAVARIRSPRFWTTIPGCVSDNFCNSGGNLPLLPYIFVILVIMLSFPVFCQEFGAGIKEFVGKIAEYGAENSPETPKPPKLGWTQNWGQFPRGLGKIHIWFISVPLSLFIWF